MKQPSSISAGKVTSSPCIRTRRTNPTNRCSSLQTCLFRGLSSVLLLETCGQAEGSNHRTKGRRNRYGREHKNSLGASYVQWVDRLYPDRTGMRPLLRRVDG